MRNKKFYQSGFYKNGYGQGDEVHLPDNPFPQRYQNIIRNVSFENMDIDLPERCIDQIITSPPYNVGKEYDKEMDLEQYIGFIRKFMEKSMRVLKSGGRLCINIGNIGRNPYIPITAYITMEAIEIGFKMRGDIIWYKGAGVGLSTAWGSFMSSSNPTLRDTHEYILIFCKDSFGRDNLGRKDTITRAQFSEYTKSVWHFQPAKAKDIGHPAPFPIDLPYRLIQLYSFKDDVVLDPFMGSGTTALACQMLGRTYFGYETDPEYCKLAEFRLERDKRIPGMELIGF